MARQDINIGIEGNDGTGDSIRASFKKVNENFVELYAVFGLGGRINFTTLSDTPDVLTPQTIPIVNNAGTQIMLAELDTDSDNSIMMEVTDGVGNTPGKIKLISKFGRVADDVTPRLGGPLYAAGNAIAGVEISQEAVDYLNAIHETELTEDQLVITKGYADLRYLTTDVPIKLDEEAEGKNHFTWEVFDYISSPGQFYSSLKIVKHINKEQKEVATGHGLDSAWNGTAIRMNFIMSVPSVFSDYRTEKYYIRVINEEHLWLYEERYKEFSITSNIDDAKSYALDVTAASIPPGDLHTMTIASYDPDLNGNYLGDEVVPRKDLVYRHGDTMTGPLYMSDHPGDLRGSGNPNGKEDLQVVTKLYVDQGSAYSAPHLLYVSEAGDDRMIGVPAGKEGSSPSYAFRTLGAAAERAEELIKTSPVVPGPYKQRLTFADGSDVVDTHIMNTRIKDGTENQGFNEDVRVLLEMNKQFIAEETYAYIMDKYPEYPEKEDKFKNELKDMINAVIMDMNQGSTSNFLSIRAAEVYYSSTDGRRTITFYKDLMLDMLDFAKSLSQRVLLQDYTHQGMIAEIKTGEITQLVLELPNTNYVTGSQIRLEGIPASHFLNVMNDMTFFIKEIDFDIRGYELYIDANLLQPYDTTGIGDYDNTNGTDITKTGIIYQSTELQVFDSSFTSMAPSRLMAVDHKWEVIADIIGDGLDAAPELSYGKPYQILVKNNNVGHLIQTDINSLDARAGKVIVGVYSNAIAEIVRFTNNSEADIMTDPLDPTHTEIGPTVFDLHLLTPHHFQIGEPIEFANGIQAKEITIKVEPGTYEEDYPIRLTKNVSLRGEDFRRCIIKPRLEKGSYISRTSQSKWAGLFMCRDTEIDAMPITRPGMTDFVNQDGIVQGSFGHHYLHDPSKAKNIGNLITVTSDNHNAADVLEANEDFIVVESLHQFIANFPTTPINKDAVEVEIRRIVKGLVHDFRIGGLDQTLETQGYYYNNHRQAFSNSTHTLAYINYIHTAAGELLDDVTVTTDNTTVEPMILRDDDNVRIIGEPDTITMLAGMMDLIRFAFDANFNPPLRNSDMDVFMLDDATIIKEITCRGHGGFMCVLDPEGQILTRSPYIQSSASFSRSLNRKTFSGGMFLDAYAGNMPLKILEVYDDVADQALTVYDASTNTYGSLTLRVQSPPGQGLYHRPPLLPAPFYIEGRRYQINAFSDYDRSLGTCTVYLDNTTNDSFGYVLEQLGDNTVVTSITRPDGGRSYAYPAGSERMVFLQSAGNRSALANGFTQINDLGYGIVVSNGAYTEQVSVFTYYCHAAFYANNGSEIRSLNSSNGYGNFGLVAEGADPNEIPDQVELKYGMIMPCKTQRPDPNDNLEGNSNVILTGFTRDPHPSCEITINHNGTLNALNQPIQRQNYEVSSVTYLSGTGVNALYRFTLQPNDSVDNDYHGTLQAPTADGTTVEYRDSKQFTVTGVRSQASLRTRPSTAINFDESDDVTYRTLDFQFHDIRGIDLDREETRITVEQPYQWVRLFVEPDHFSAGYGGNGGDQRLAITALGEGSDYSDESRIVGKQFAWNGRLFTVTEYHRVYQFETSSTSGFSTDASFTTSNGATGKIVKPKNSYMTYAYDITGNIGAGDTVSGQSVTSGMVPSEWGFIKFTYVSGSDILGNTGNGITSSIRSDVEFLYAGPPEDETGEITIGISVLRATGHDFTQIGTGSFNDTNYPSVIYGQPKNPLAGYYTDTPGATTSQVWEKRKGRVFWVSTDQYGFFRVGQYFNVDQGTGSITFSGSVGISNAVSLGFTKGVTVDEFSPDDTFVDMSSTAVPTEKATAGYISKVLGYDFNTFKIYNNAAGRIGPGFLPLDGIRSNASMTGDLHMGSNRITDVAVPINLDDAVNKAYVDDNSSLYMEIQKQRDWGRAHRTLEIDENQIVICTGKRIIYVNIPSSGSFTPGMQIRNTSNPASSTITGTVIQSISYQDELFGDIIKVIYTPNSLLGGRSFDSNQDAQVFGGTYTGGVSQVQTTFISPVGDNSAVGGSFPEMSNASNDPNSLVSIETARGTDTATIKLDVKLGSITNTHISNTAIIDQTKLTLNKAKTGAPTITNPPQSDLGVAQFNNVEFTATNGFIKLKDSAGASDGILLNKLQHINTGYVLGRTGLDGPVMQVPFTTIAASTGGIVKEDFPTRWNSGVDALVRVNGAPTNAASDEYDTISISTSNTNNTIVRRTGSGDIEGRRIIAKDYYQYRDSANVVRDLFSAQGIGEANFGDVIGSNGSVLSAPSSVQNNSSYSTKFLASNWIYAKGIESANNGGNSGSGVGITFGAGTGFSDEGNATIIFFGDGTPVFSMHKVSSTAEILPLGSGTRNIGRSTKKFNTVYADVFNGTATRAYYADLAENYLADDEYNTGTVVVLGGDYEVTHCTKKDDTRVAGIISENPAHLMNSELGGDFVACVALKGRVPCKVIGRIKKGDLIVTSAVPGYAMVNNKASVGTVIGKAIGEKDTDGKGIIEVLVGRT